MPESRAAWFVGVDVGFTVLSLAVVSLRIGYRWRNHVIVLSDWMIILAMFFALCHMALDVLITVDYGYGQHEADLPPSLRNSYKTAIVFWLIQIVTKLPLLFSKVSLCLIYQDLLATADTFLVRISRIINYGTMFVIITFFTAMTLVSMFACRPLDKIWHPLKPGYCINNTAALYATSAVNVLTSILVIATPLPVLFQMKHKKAEVSQLIALVLLGVIDTVVSIFRLYMIQGLKDQKKDFTWNVIPTHIVIVIEYNITIIAASLVVMRPCFQSIFNTLFPNSIHNTANRTYPTHSSSSAAAARQGYIMASSERGITNSQKDIRRSRGVEKNRRGSPETLEMELQGMEEGREDKEIGILKTVRVEMSSRSVSTEDILRSKDRF